MVLVSFIEKTKSKYILGFGLTEYKMVLENILTYQKKNMEFGKKEKK